MFEPVADKDGVTLGLVDKFCECFDFFVVDGDVVVSGFVVDGSACELLQFEGEGCCVGGVDGVVVEVEDEVFFEGVDLLSCFGWYFNGDVLVGGFG